MNMNKIKKQKWTRPVAFLLGAILIVGLLVSNGTQVAAEDYTVADASSFDSWQDYLTDDDGNYSTENIGRIWTDKTVTDEDFTFSQGDLNGKTVAKGDSNFVVALSALSSTSNLTETTDIPLDIVLVLDVSGSMASPLSPTAVYNLDTSKTYWYQNNSTWYTATYNSGGGHGNWRGDGGETLNPKTSSTSYGGTQFYEADATRMEALQSAVNNFIDTTAVQNDSITDSSMQHRISIVKFAGTQSDAIGNSTYYDYNDKAYYNNSQRVTTLQAYDSATAPNLKDTVNGLTAAGATAADYGLTLAETELNTNGRSNAQKVVVFFTDGEPNHYSGFWQDIAAESVTKAKTLKDSGALVYTIGVFDGAVPEDTTKANFNIYMNGVSSNYPNATATYTGQSSQNNNNSRWTPKLGERVSEDAAYYKAAKNASELNSIFNEIAAEIQNSAQGVPTQSADGAHDTSGYITFTDQLGDYMQVDDFKSIVYNNIIYDFGSYGKTEDGLTYVFTAQVNANNPDETETTNLSKILITVTKGTDNKTGDTVKVQIPASLIPLREFNIDTDEGTMEVSEAYPIRIFYGVSIKDGIIEDVENEDGTITPAAIKTPDDDLKAYIVANTTDDGKVNFYSNKWSGKVDGDTTAVFEPASNNIFYYFAQNTPVYTNVNEDNKGNLTSVDKESRLKSENIDSSATYYYERTYYVADENGKVTQVTKVSTFPGSNFGIGSDNYIIDDGYVSIAPKAHRVSTINNMKTYKNSEDEEFGGATGTAKTIINPTWLSENEGVAVSVALGNNGLLTANIPGTLAISKSVTADEGLDIEQFDNKEFDFTIILKDDEGAVSGNFQAAVATGTSDPAVIENGLSFDESGTTSYKLKGNQTLYIYGLENGTSYTITESGTDGFTASVGETTGKRGEGVTVSGAIKADTYTVNNDNTVNVKINEVSFTNKYTVDSKALLGETNLKVQKILTGREWDSTDSFEFELAAASFQASQDSSIDTAESTLASMPKPDQTILNVNNDSVMNFGNITFTKPGIYVYTISERTPTTSGLPNVTYSSALYKITVTVSDNGDGTLDVSSTMVQTEDDAGNEIDNPVDVAVITNEFSTDNQGVSIYAAKNYTDNSGANGLERGKFEFKLKAIDGAPLPDNQIADVDGYIYEVNAVDGSVAFPNITFTSARDDGKTYTYELSEKIPGGATAENNYTVNGMTYDPSVYTVRVSVNVDAEGNLEAVTTYYDAANNEVLVPGTETPAGRAYFTNSYTPVSVTLSGDTALHGSKTLTGRDMLASDIFNFTLTNTGTTDGVSIAEVGDKASVNGGASSTFNFGDVTFTKPGTYTFKIEETPGETGKGIAYDNNVCTVTVDVTDTDGVLSAVVKYSNDKYTDDDTQAVFKNTYTASGSYNDGTGLVISKTMTGRSTIADEFSYVVTKNNETVETGSWGSANSGTARETTILKNLTFNQNDAGNTYEYIVSEDIPVDADKAPGVTYDQSEYKISIQVTDQGDGTLAVNSTITRVKNADGTDANESVEAIAFNNSYKAAPATVDTGSTEIGLNKVISGRDWLDSDSFVFTIANTDKPDNVENAPMPNLNSITVTSNSAKVGESVPFGFGNIEFTQAGKYVYTVSESNAGNTTNGLTYANTTATITINVTDNIEKGRLEAVVSVENRTFTNTYSVNETSLAAKAALSVQKTLSGRDWAENEKFEFTLNDNDSVIETLELSKPENDNVQTGTFKDITYTAAGTYNYTVTETKKENPAAGMSYSEKAYTVTVEVSEDYTTGTLSVTSVTVTDENGNSVTPTEGNIYTLSFENIYNQPENTKKVDVTQGEGGGANTISDAGGKLVGVGDTLTYTITWVNDAIGDDGLPVKAEVTITDEIPDGTSLVEDSISEDGKLGEDGKTITWNLGEQEANAAGTVSFQVTVNDVKAGSNSEISNEAKVQVGENDPRTTTKVSNYVPTKTVTASNNSVANEAQAGDILTYTISYMNTEEDAQTIRIIDVLPETLDYVDGTVSAGGSYDSDSRTLTWTLDSVAAGTGGTVSFQAKVNEKAIGETVDNKAAINVGNNSYSTNTTGTKVSEGKDLTISKKIELTSNQGTEIDTAKEFTFTINLADTNGDALTGGYTYSIDGAEQEVLVANGSQITLKHGQEAVISGLPVGASYAVVEAAVEGYTSNAKDNTITGTISEDQDNKAEFINTYGATMKGGVDTSALFSKELVGRDWTENDAFSFTLAPDDETYPMPIDEDGNVVSTVTVGKPETGNVAVFGFGTIAFDAVGTYTYKVSEVIPDAENALTGISYDKHSATLSIKVTDDGAGNLVAATPTVTDGTFANNYMAEIDYAAAGGLKLTKTLNGRDMTAGQFKFQVTPSDQASAEKLGLDEGANEVISPAGTDESSVDINLLAGKTVIFTQDDAGKTYSYTVQEVNDEQPGYSYDADVRTVTIAVSDNGNATLTVTTTVTKGSEEPKAYTYTTGQTDAEAAVIPFVNGYNASTDVEGGTKAAVSTTKALTGRPIADGEFHFQITAQGHPEIVVVNDVVNDAKGNVNFGELSYDTASLKAAAKAGYAVKDADGNWTVSYTASEKTDSLSAIGVTPTKSSFDFTVTVVDNGNGTLTATASMPEGAGFANTYSTGDPILFNVNGSKVLSAAQGLTPPDIAGKYKFTITGEEGAPMPEKTEAANDEYGNIDFGKISFSLDVFNAEAASEEVTEENDEAVLETTEPENSGIRTNTFIYTVTESGTAAGVTNDAVAAKTFTVTVTDNGQGTLTVTSDPSTTSLFTFTNTYSVTSISSSITDQISIEKRLDGRNLAAEEFSFALAEGNTVVAYGKNDADGKVTFDAIEYTEPGSHTYSVYEVKGEDGKGITYDSTQYTINTTVADKGDGTLEVTHTTEAEGGIVFENKYEAAPTSVTIGASKVLTGRDLKKDEFTFQLKDKDGSVVAEAKNDENGQVIFEAQKYEKAGTYEYTISEVNDKQDNITYDETEYKVTVTVTDDGTGYLTAEVTGDAAVFTNTYVEPKEPQSPQEPKNTEKPKKSRVKTGDQARIALLGVLMIVAFVLIVAEVVLIHRRRRHR